LIGQRGADAFFSRLPAWPAEEAHRPGTSYDAPPAGARAAVSPANRLRPEDDARYHNFLHPESRTQSVDDLFSRPDLLEPGPSPEDAAPGGSDEGRAPPPQVGEGAE